MQPSFLLPLLSDRITTANTALLAIDMENDFVAAGAVQETPGARDIIALRVGNELVG
jgi:hypothetical protein